MPVLVKICGLSTPDALETALEAGADMVGFVFFEPSPRHLGLEAARTLGARVRGRAKKVALTVDASDDALARPGRGGAHALRPAGDQGAAGRAARGPRPDPHLREDRRPHPVRRPRAARGDAARRPRPAVRLAAPGEP